MWKKEDGPEPVSYMPPAPPAPPTVTPRPEPVATPRVTNDRATIGKSITVRGDVSGDEDLLIQGRIEGSVNLKQHAVVVGREGEVKADVIARMITVEGLVEGNLTAEEQVILRASAVLQGNITSPRVVLEDGARFRGGVDTGEMQPGAATHATGARTSQQASQPARTPAVVVETASKTATGTPAEADKAASSVSGDGGARKRAEVTA